MLTPATPTRTKARTVSATTQDRQSRLRHPPSPTHRPLRQLLASIARLRSRRVRPQTSSCLQEETVALVAGGHTFARRTVPATEAVGPEPEAAPLEKWGWAGGTGSARARGSAPRQRHRRRVKPNPTRGTWATSTCCRLRVGAGQEPCRCLAVLQDVTGAHDCDATTRRRSTGR